MRERQIEKPSDDVRTTTMTTICKCSSVVFVCTGIIALLLSFTTGSSNWTPPAAIVEGAVNEDSKEKNIGRHSMPPVEYLGYNGSDAFNGRGSHFIFIHDVWQSSHQILMDQSPTRLGNELLLDRHFQKVFPPRTTRTRSRRRILKQRRALVIRQKLISGATSLWRLLWSYHDVTGLSSHLLEPLYISRSAADDLISTTRTRSTTGRWIKSRALEENDASNDDDSNADNDNNNDSDDSTDDATNKYGGNGDNELCSAFLVSFLEGTTDARDTCEGIMNAYVAADCSVTGKGSTEQDYDDYFQDFTEHQCCQALQQHHTDYCEEDTLLTNFHLFVAVAVLLLCECAKAAVVHYRIHFLPEAGVCILVGTAVGTVLQLLSEFLPVSNIDELSFDDELFMSLLLPPIIFEAALSVSKFEFKRRRGAIFMFSVFGTLISTFSTGFMVHYVSKWSNSQTFPMLDSLVFGALISSIDPVAILSVLSNLNLDQRDTIFILVFGESLLNDGIAITVFQTLVDRFDGKTKDNSTSVDEILDAIATFMIAMFGSIVVGLACGCGAWGYFNMLGNLLPPVMEVGSFFLWALIPYYICDGIGWSGIVSIVAVGFFMDIYIAGPKGQTTSLDLDGDRSISPSSLDKNSTSTIANKHEQETNAAVSTGHYRGMDDELGSADICRIKTVDSMQTSRSIGPLPSTERINMSATADRHVRFVAHLTSQLAENAIFSYIGLFLFSNNYDWNPSLVWIAISSCILSRMLMVIVVSYLMYHIYKCRGVESSGSNSSRTAAAIQDPRTQAVLVLAGLRGAVSLALVENVPIYNNVTGEGCEFKQLMKGMTSSCILFTTFIFGGGAYYILPHLGIKQDHNQNQRPTSPFSSPASSSNGSTNNARNHNGACNSTTSCTNDIISSSLTKHQHNIHNHRLAQPQAMTNKDYNIMDVNDGHHHKMRPIL